MMSVPSSDWFLLQGASFLVFTRTHSFLVYLKCNFLLWVWQLLSPLVTVYKILSFRQRPHGKMQRRALQNQRPAWPFPLALVEGQQHSPVTTLCHWSWCHLKSIFLMIFRHSQLSWVYWVILASYVLSLQHLPITKDTLLWGYQRS